MTRPEWLARLLIGAAVFAAVAVPLALRSRTPLVHARMADDGGWSPDTMRAQGGVPLELHLTSDDVVHGFAVGKLDLPAVDILPGKVTDIELLEEGDMSVPLKIDRFPNRTGFHHTEFMFYYCLASDRELPLYGEFCDWPCNSCVLGVQGADLGARYPA